MMHNVSMSGKKLDQQQKSVAKTLPALPLRRERVGWYLGDHLYTSDGSWKWFWTVLATILPLV